MSLEDKVRDIIADILQIPPEEILPEKSFFGDLGADSIALVELVLAMENEFGVEIPDEEVDKIKTVQDALNYIKTVQG